MIFIEAPSNTLSLSLSLSPAGRHQGGRLHCGDCRHGCEMVFTSAGGASDTIMWCCTGTKGHHSHGSQLSEGSIRFPHLGAAPLILPLTASLLEGFHINAIGSEFFGCLVRLVQPHQHNHKAQAATEDIRQDTLCGQRLIQFVESLSTHTESGEDLLRKSRDSPSSISEYAFIDSKQWPFWFAHYRKLDLLPFFFWKYL